MQSIKFTNNLSPGMGSSIHNSMNISTLQHPVQYSFFLPDMSVSFYQTIRLHITEYSIIHDKQSFSAFFLSYVACDLKFTN